MQESSDRVEDGASVAEESRTMLKEISEVSVRIGHYIDSITEATQSMGPSNQRVAAVLENITHLSEDVSTNMQEVAASVEEQAGSVEEIAALMNQLEGMSRELYDLISLYTPSAENATP
jgi:methyl-accepting chemotaxis protein